MAPLREANSLSSITQLAGNPPSHPRNPTERKRESLVLYIARVPGSRDVILNTMKPRLKMVTAEDVINCLYYLHVDTPNDAFLLEQTLGLEDSEPGREPHEATILRKPLRENSPTSIPPVPSLLASQSQVIGLSSPSNLPPLPAQKAFGDWQPPLPQRSPPQDNPALPPRRPLGPRALSAQPRTNISPLPGLENAPWRTSIQPPATRFSNKFGRPRSQISHSEDFLKKKVTNQPPTSLSTFDTASAIDPVSITIIRRDPASGAQWNIGAISSQAINEDSNLLDDRTSKSGKLCSSVFVQLVTSGYEQFRTSPDSNNTKAGDTPATSQQAIQNADLVFRRQVNMEWSSTWGRKFKMHRRGISDQSDSRRAAQMRSSTDVTSELIGTKCEDYNKKHPLAPKVPACGFISPWNGRCEFTLGGDGRTLKCKHVLPSSVKLAIPAVSTSNSFVDVSELRFNIPSKGPATPGGSHLEFGRAMRTRPQQVRSSSSMDLQKSTRAPLTSYAAMYPSDDDEYDNEDEDNDSSDRVDLFSLGREKAGGGNKGKRAKLGKLIVQDEGLKMLDLVVAANMGLWWTIWER